SRCWCSRPTCSGTGCASAWIRSSETARPTRRRTTTEALEVQFMVKRAFAILPVLTLMYGVAWGQSAPSTSKPILSGPLAKLDIKDAQIAAGRGAPKGALNVGLHFGIDPGWFDPLGYYGPALHFKGPFVDFLDLYSGSGSGIGWIVPRHYYEQVGKDGFKARPMGAGPFKFVSQEAGVQASFEAWDQYWRRAPGVKTINVRGIRDLAARMAGLETGELDIAYG